MYIWARDLETGNTMIDTQHKQLIQAINNLLEACAKGQGRTQIDETLKFLNNYITSHFKDEEALQQKYQYPDYINHRQYHEGFKKVVKEIIREYEKEGATIVLVGKVNKNIGEWLINHIKREDKKVAQHIKNK